MLQSNIFRSLSVAGFLALAIALYAISSPNEGLLSGPSAVSTLFQSLQLVRF